MGIKRYIFEKYWNIAQENVRKLAFQALNAWECLKYTIVFCKHIFCHPTYLKNIITNNKQEIFKNPNLWDSLSDSSLDYIAESPLDNSSVNTYSSSSDIAGVLSKSWV